MKNILLFLIYNTLKKVDTLKEQRCQDTDIQKNSSFKTVLMKSEFVKTIIKI